MSLTRRFAATAAILTAISLAGSSVVSATDLSYSDLVDRIEALEAELQSQDVKLAACDSCLGSPSCGCASGCCGTDCCACPAWYVGYELTALHPEISDANFANWFEDDDYGIGHRFVMGYDGSCGMGVRLRYWFYNHGHDLVPPPGSMHIDMDVLDAEVTLYQQLLNWRLMVAGGLRYGRLGLAGAAIGDADGFYFEGVGPTVALEGVRGFGSRGFYLVGNMRAAFLAGDWNDYFSVPGGKIDGEIMTVLETQLGLGWRRGALDVRTVFETQHWLNSTIADEFNGIGSNVAFYGPTVSVGLTF